MAELAAAQVAARSSTPTTAAEAKGAIVAYALQSGKARKDDMHAPNERERISKQRAGITFENIRFQMVMALRLCTGGDRTLAPDDTRLEAYTSMLGLKTEPPSRSPALVAAGCNMTHVIAAYLVELRVSNTADGAEGIGVMETPYEADEAALAVRRKDMSEHIHLASRLKNDRVRQAPNRLTAVEWVLNRTALCSLIGAHIGERAGEALTTLVIQEGIKAGKVGYTVQMADELFCGVVRKWVQAGFTLVKAADVGIYMDVVDAGELISAHITAYPSQVVRPPCAENYPTVLADRAADDEVLFDAARSRLVEEQRAHQTKALKGAPAARAGEGDPPTVGPPPDGDVGGVGSGVGAGKGKVSPKRSAGEKRRATVERQVKAALEAADAGEETRHGALSGSPGGAPVGGGTPAGPGATGATRFECPSTTKAAASGKDPKGERGTCRSADAASAGSWPVVLGKQGKPFNGQVQSCVGQKDFFHGSYPDDLKIDASVLANMRHMGGCVLLPMTETAEKQKSAHGLLMTDGATRTAKEWKTWGTNQKFDESEKPVHISELKPTVEIAPGFVRRPPDPAADATGLESLIAANGGASAVSANLREDEAPLAVAA